MISDQSVRDRVTHDHETLFAVDAGAGTGKTTLLVSRLIALLVEKKAPLSRIAAITFTEKAAAELADRLRSKLELALVEHPESQALILKALEDMEKAPISTIHSFCAGLLREYPVEAGVDPQFTLLDEVQSGAFETQAWEHWLKKNLAQPVEALFQFQRMGGTFEQMDDLKLFLKRNRTLLKDAAPKPLPSVEDFQDQLKSFVALTKKEAIQCAKHEDTLYKTLEVFWGESEATLEKNPSTLTPALSPQGRGGNPAKPSPRLSGVASAKPDEGGNPEDLAFELANLKIPKVGNKGAQGNWGKERLASLREGFVKLAEDQEKAYAPFKEAIVLNLVHWIDAYLKEWENQKNQKGFLDFDDLLLKTRDLLLKHPEAREEIKDRFDHLFVDEFQDTDPLQVAIVFFLSEKIGKSEKDWRKVKLEQGKLFLVGDPKQSIYRFRRADVAIYEETKALIQANGGKVEILTENFRTVGGLVEWVNGCFPAQFEGSGIHYHGLSANRKKGETEGTLPILWGLKVPLPEEAQNSKAYFRQLEAETVAAFLKEQVLGQGYTISDPKTHQPRLVQLGDIAILFRDFSNDIEEYWEEALRKRNLSYQIVGGKRFYNRPEIVALSTLLTCLSSPADEAVCVAVLRGPLFGFSDEELFLHRVQGGSFRFLESTEGKMKEAFRYLRDWYKATRTLGVSDTLTQLYEKTNLLAVTAGQPHGEQRVANLMKVQDQARELETSQHFTYRAFTQWLTTQQQEEVMEGEAPGPDSSEDRITLMTIHKAKGLEFPVVVVSAWAAKPQDKGSFVDRKYSAGAFKVGDKDLGLKTTNHDAVKAEEELQRKAEDTRLLYVAATRARDALLLPHFTLPSEGRLKNETLFAEPLLKALEEKGSPVRSEPRPPAEAEDLTVPASLQTPVHWAEMKEEPKALEDPSAWVSPLDATFDPKILSQEKEKLKAQQEGRKEMLKKLCGGKEFKSVTSVLDVDRDKRERKERVFEESETTSPWGGKDLGSLAHLLLEKGWNWNEELIVKAALAWAPSLNLSEEKAREAARMVFQALSREFFQRVKKASGVFRELPMVGRASSGEFLNAVIDLAFLEEGEWVIVDYKTDRDREKNGEKYRQQLNAYEKLLTERTGKPVKEKWLYFLRSEDPLEKVR